MLISTDSWQVKAEQKRNETLGKIPLEWRLPESELEKALKQRNLTGAFFDQYLETHDISIVRQDATHIVDQVQKGQLSAKEVTLAFCKAAAVSHQIVSRASLFVLPFAQADLTRITACMRSSSRRLSQERRS